MGRYRLLTMYVWQTQVDSVVLISSDVYYPNDIEGAGDDARKYWATYPKHCDGHRTGDQEKRAWEGNVG